MIRAWVPVLVWLVAGGAVTACRPLPPIPQADAGMAALRGVVFERLHQAHRQVRIHAPAASLDLDGTHVLMEAPHGQAQVNPDGGLYRWRATRLSADVASGSYAVEGVVVLDEQGRELTTPSVQYDVDGGVLLAAPPVKVTGANFWMTSQGGAQVHLPQQELLLVGPVEARAWPPDAGPPAW